ncbi:hypothetical protein ACLB2K_048546 [Fragaria x ananassa]
MGGCCCCSSKATELRAAPTYYYVYPRTSEEHVPLSSRQGASALSTGLLVDTNLDTSIPDTYRPPPAPIPYDVSAERPQTPPVAQDISGNKSDATLHTTTSDSVQQAPGDNPQETSTKCEDLKGSDYKADTKFELDPIKKADVELSKSVDSVALVTEEEDVCPTCLEEYDGENPRITTKCDHHFHLACILEWMERSDTCPMCDKEMIFDPPID